MPLKSTTPEPDPDTRRAEIAARVREQFAQPLDPLSFTAEASGRYAMQVRQLRDALVRFGTHLDNCRITEALATGEALDGLVCRCGLDDAIREGSR